jgi:alcohol-forming fatty acyl-CoA reductase
MHAAYVVGERQGLVSERPFKLGETLSEEGTHQLDIEGELQLARDCKMQLVEDDREKNERKAMKELGLARYTVVERKMSEAISYS